MALPAPKNFEADYAPISQDRFTIELTWDPVPGAVYYNLYRDLDKIEVRPDAVTGLYQYKTVGGQQQIVYRDADAWFYGNSLDLFFWVAAVEQDPNTLEFIEGTMSEAITNLHPFALRAVELARASLGDDLRIFNEDQSKVAEQISIYNYKLAADRALSAINQTPTFTTYSFGNFPHIWQDLLIQGTLVKVLPKIILLEQAKSMKFTDQGQDWAPPDISGALKELLKTWNEDFNSTRKEVKHNVRPHGMGVGSLHALFISPQLLKWRHVPTGRNFF